jgi:hypothetical protein
VLQSKLNVLIILFLSLFLVAWIYADPCSETSTPLTALSSSSTCNECFFTLLPGSLTSNPVTKYYIQSDLPEVLTSPGILYATVPVLPPNGTSPTNMLTQITTGGFQTVDNNFDVFLFHITKPGDGSQPRRIIVYVKNNGSSPVTIFPKQVIVSDGIIGTVHQMESTLGARVLADNWDTPISTVTLNPGQGNVIAYGKQFGASYNSSDQSANVNSFGRVRATVSNASSAIYPTNLAVYDIAIPGASTTQNQTLAESIITGFTAASSGDFVTMTHPPQGCALARCVGMMNTFVWRSSTITTDVNGLNTTLFQMAVPQIQSSGCSSARQTGNLILRPGYTRPDSVGNYMIDYRVYFHFFNSNPTTAKIVDLGFQKSDADIGLAWKIATSDSSLNDSIVDNMPVRTSWAGPKQSNIYKSFLQFDGGYINLAPCSDTTIGIHFLILGNSSLPFQLELRPFSPLTNQVQNPILSPHAWRDIPDTTNSKP